MAIRRSSSYSKKHVVPYTRTSKKKEKAYIKAVPASVIVKFRMGNLGLYEAGKLPHVLTLVTTEDIQIRQNAIEACRQFLHKKLDEKFNGQYYFKIIPFAHHVQRENKMLSGAGADRMQTGMQLSFGKTIAKAAILRDNEGIMLIAVTNQKAASFVREILKQIKAKLPCKTRVIYEVKE